MDSGIIIFAQSTWKMPLKMCPKNVAAPNLPEDSGPGSLSSASKTLIINVRRDGGYYIQNSVKNLQAVEKVVSDALTQNPGQKVLIRGDREALHGHVADVVRICKSSGVQEANIGYQYRAIQ